MKIAGTKNDGAWFRANRFIKNASVNDRADIATGIAAIDTLPAFGTAMADIAQKTGVTLPDGLTDGTSYAAALSTGIPRQVWEGKLTFDTYTKGVNSKGKTVFKPDHAKAARAFAGDLRAFITRFKFAKAELIDVENIVVGKKKNRGGKADDDKTT